jgi:RNA polymerase sigma factor (sigma-70 family)
MANTQLRAVVHSLRHLCAAEEHRQQADGELLAAFLSRRDQTAFTAIVRRHGPMVLGVCRRMLARPEDAEDCFQATFLLLARRAVSVRKRESLGSWLHGVAYRMATNSRRAAARRRAHEARAAAAPAPNPAWLAAWREVQAVLDDEIQRLPAAYRQAFILCGLEGKGCAEAARELGQQEGTVWSRVARARGLLRARLARRGVSLALVLAAGAVSDNALRAAVPAEFVRATARVAAGRVPPSASVGALVQRGVPGMVGGKVKGIATALFLAGALVVGAGALARQQGAVAPGAPPAGKDLPPAPEGAKDTEPKEAQAAVDRYGDALPPGALARMGTVRFRPGDSVGRLAFSPDGKLLASGNWHMSVRLWEAASGKEVRRIPGPHYFIAFADGGKAIVTRHGRDEYDLHLWDVATGKELRTIPVAEFRQYTELSPDGKVLVTAAYKGKVVYVHDPGNGAETHKIETKGVVGLALSPDGKTAAALEQDNLEKKGTAVRLWDTATGKELRMIEVPFSVRDGDVTPLAFSPDGKTLAGAPADKAIRLWDVTTGKELRSLKGHGGPVQALAFSPDGKVLASGGRDQTVRLWEVSSGKELHHMTGHRSWVQALAFAPDGRTVASGAQDNTIRRWDVATGKEIAPPGGHEYWVFTAALSPDGKTLATGAGDGTIRLWVAGTGEELRKIDTGHGWVNSVAFSPDGKSLVSGGWDKTIRLWDTATGKELRRIEGHGAEVIRVAFSPDGKLIASAPKVSFRDGKRLPPNEQDSAVRLWDASTGKEVGRLEGHPDGATCLAFSPDGKRLVTAAGAWEGVPHVWDVGARKEMLHLGASARSVAFSPDGRFLAVGGRVSNGTVEMLGQALQLWDTSTGKVVRQFHREPRVEKRRGAIAVGGGKPVVVSEGPGPRFVNGVAFTPDGRCLVSAESDGSVVVWEVLTGQVRREFLGHQGEVNGLAVSPDGRKAASVSTDLTALVWDVTGLLHRGPRPGRATAERLAEHWDALGGQDAEKAGRAALALTATPDQAVELLKKKLLPDATPPDAARVDRLIADLDSETFDTREAAERELGRLGRAVEPALRKALKGSSSAEQKQRLEKLVGALDASARSQDVTASRAVEVLEWVGTPEAKRLLDELTRGAPGTRLTEEAAAALRRLRRESGPRP